MHVDNKKLSIWSKPQNVLKLPGRSSRKCFTGCSYSFRRHLHLIYCRARTMRGHNHVSNNAWELGHYLRDHASKQILWQKKWLVKYHWEQKSSNHFPQRVIPILYSQFLSYSFTRDISKIMHAFHSFALQFLRVRHQKPYSGHNPDPVTSTSQLLYRRFQWVFH